MSLKSNASFTFDMSNLYSKIDIDIMMSNVLSIDTVYTKSEMYDLLLLKANTADVATYSYINNLLDGKVSSGDVYKISDIDTIIQNVKDLIPYTCYTKTQTDNLLLDKPSLSTMNNLLDGKISSGDVYQQHIQKLYAMVNMHYFQIFKLIWGNSFKNLRPFARPCKHFNI